MTTTPSNSTASPPRQLVLLLAAIVLCRLAASLLSSGFNIPGFLLTLLLAALSASVLIGKRSAARALMYLLYAAGGLSLLVPLFSASPWYSVSITAGWGALAIYTARYIQRNVDVAIFLRYNIVDAKPAGDDKSAA
jgi:hypothetical protein